MNRTIVSIEFPVTYFSENKIVWVKIILVLFYNFIWTFPPHYSLFEIIILIKAGDDKFKWKNKIYDFVIISKKSPIFKVSSLQMVYL